MTIYAAHVTMDAIHEMFFNAKDIMRWLAVCAKQIARQGNTVEWTTPLGLPVSQPYRKLVLIKCLNILYIRNKIRIEKR